MPWLSKFWFCRFISVGSVQGRQAHFDLKKKGLWVRLWLQGSWLINILINTKYCTQNKTLSHFLSLYSNRLINAVFALINWPTKWLLRGRRREKTYREINVITHAIMIYGIYFPNRETDVQLQMTVCKKKKKKQKTYPFWTIFST